MRGAILLRKVQGTLAACIRGGFGFRMISGGGSTSLASLCFSLCLLCVLPILVFGLLALILTGAPAHQMAFDPSVLAVGAFGITLAEKRKNLETIAKDAEAIEKKYEGKAMPEDEGAKLEKLYEEGEALSIEVDKELRNDNRRTRVKSTLGALGEVEDPALPGNRQKDDRPKSRIAGYITPGQMFSMSPVLQNYVRNGRIPKKASDPFEVRSLLAVPNAAPGGLIALNEEEVKAYQARVEEFEAKRYEAKDVTDVIPVIGTDVIAPNRVDRFVQVTRPDRLTLRDLLNVSPTSSPVIDYVREESYSESAGIVSEGATKPQAAVEYSKQRANVVTVAVWIPVTIQQLQDAPALINRIDQRLLWDLRKAEEQEIGYGNGSGEHFEGLFDSGSNIDAMRTEVGDTLIDIIRRGITDVLTSGYDPNGLWIHPEDWETIELAKGSDGHYVWAIIRDTLGPRVWGLRVVEGVGTRKRGDTTTNMAVGDFRAGATLYDRMQAAISIGLINEQFIENLRTILAEERVAWALEAPAAFRIHETAS
jgi:HK97 family phage major capsid protein